MFDLQRFFDRSITRVGRREAMVSILEIKMMERYRIDRGSGTTADGSTELVILVLKASGERELACAMSKADAMIVATQLQQAAGEAQATMHAKF
jgi:hypothetical protein